MAKISAMGLGRWLSKKVLTTQTQRPEFRSQACLYKASIIPTLGRQRQEDLGSY